MRSSRRSVSVAQPAVIAVMMVLIPIAVIIRTTALRTVHLIEVRRNTSAGAVIAEVARLRLRLRVVVVVGGVVDIAVNHAPAVDVVDDDNMHVFEVLNKRVQVCQWEPTACVVAALDLKMPVGRLVD